MRVGIRDAQHRRVERVEFLFHDDCRQLGAEPQRLDVLVDHQHAARFVERPEDWPKIAEFLRMPGLREYREFAAYVARVLDKDAEAPVESTATFLMKANFDLKVRRVQVRIPVLITVAL